MTIPEKERLAASHSRPQEKQCPEILCYSFALGLHGIKQFPLGIQRHEEGTEDAHSPRGVQGALNPNQKDPPRKADAFCPLRGGDFQRSGYGPQGESQNDAANY